jgi:hypothetical protein
MRALILTIMLAIFPFACGCSRKTEHTEGVAEPTGTYRRALDGADSAAARAGRRAAQLDSASVAGR